MSKVLPNCSRPPKGWFCPKHEGHDGPCPAVKIPATIKLVEELDFHRELTPVTKRIGLVAAWYDMWVGAFWDRKKKRLYILPIPFFGIYIDFSR